MDIYPKQITVNNIYICLVIGYTRTIELSDNKIKQAHRVGNIKFRAKA